MLAYDQEETTLPTLEQRELKFYKERVVPYSLEFTNYGRGSMLDRTNILQQGMGVKTTNRYYFHKNQLGSIIGLSNGSGDIVMEYGYDDYGKVFVKTGNGEYISIENYDGNDYSNVRLYTGREYDKELGRYYYRARMYSPELGRFTSIDPIGPKDDINMFTYVGNNPINRIDPMGLEKVLVVVGFGSVLTNGNGKSYNVQNLPKFSGKPWSEITNILKDNGYGLLAEYTDGSGNPVQNRQHCDGSVCRLEEDHYHKQHGNGKTNPTKYFDDEGNQVDRDSNKAHIPSGGNDTKSITSIDQSKIVGREMIRDDGTSYFVPNLNYGGGVGTYFIPHIEYGGLPSFNIRMPNTIPSLAW